MNWEKKLSQDLGLMETGQDFGIINANGRRLSEFIKYFNTNTAIDPWEWEELADLIFESANDAILEKYITQEQIDDVLNILKFHRKKFPNKFEYWQNLKNERQYPITVFVKQKVKA